MIKLATVAMGKPNILFIHYNQDSTGSFVDKIIYQLEYFQKDYNVYVMVPGEGSLTERLRKKNATLIFKRFHENEGIFSYLRHAVAFGSFLLKHRIKLIYLADYVWWKPAELLAARILKIPVVSFIGFYKTREALRGFLKYSAKIIVNSQKTGEVFFSSNLKDRTKVIHNFIDVEKYADARSIRENLCEPGNKLIGYVGTLHPIKGIEHFLKAAGLILDKYPEIRFIIAGGEKEPGFERKLKDLSDHLGLSSAVKFLGHRDDIPAIMKSLDILVVPSLDEPFGYVVVEGGAAGTPVVASRIGGIPEIIVDGETGILVEPGSAGEILKACSFLLSNPGRAQSMGQAAAKRAKELFGTEEAIRKWEKIFSELLTR